MNFNTHYDLAGLHAFLGASKYHWINYNEDKIVESYSKFVAIQRGTELHDFARHCIALKQKLSPSKKSLNMYVNDAIGYRMTPEQPLFYSENAFGTADAICFHNDFLRIHDLKTGVLAVSMHQLEVYTAMFCLEYKKDPRAIQIELRIYQNNEILCHIPEPEVILIIMDKIVRFDKMIAKIKTEMEE
jgi:hypothetical protein